MDDPVGLQVHCDLDPRPGAVGIEVEPLDADRLAEGSAGHGIGNCVVHRRKTLNI